MMLSSAAFVCHLASFPFVITLLNFTAKIDDDDDDDAAALENTAPGCGSASAYCCGSKCNYEGKNLKI